MAEPSQPVGGGAKIVHFLSSPCCIPSTRNVRLIESEEIRQISHPEGLRAQRNRYRNQFIHHAVP